MTYEQWLSIAVGEMGISPEVFDEMTVAHFLYAVVGYKRRELARSREEWERVRWATYNVMRLELTKEVRMVELLPLPWDRREVKDRQCDVEKRKKAASEMLAMVTK